jgi:hypothetical protein
LVARLVGYAQRKARGVMEKRSCHQTHFAGAIREDKRA